MAEIRAESSFHPADSVLQSLFSFQWEMDRLLSTAICVELISWQGKQKDTNYRKMSAGFISFVG